MCSKHGVRTSVTNAAVATVWCRRNYLFHARTARKESRLGLWHKKGTKRALPPASGSPCQISSAGGGSRGSLRRHVPRKMLQLAWGWRLASVLGPFGHLPGRAASNKGARGRKLLCKCKRSRAPMTAGPIASSTRMSSSKRSQLLRVQRQLRLAFGACRH